MGEITEPWDDADAEREVLVDLIVPAAQAQYEHALQRWSALDAKGLRPDRSRGCRNRWPSCSTQRSEQRVVDAGSRVRNCRLLLRSDDLAARVHLRTRPSRLPRRDAHPASARRREAHAREPVGRNGQRGASKWALRFSPSL